MPRADLDRDGGVSVLEAFLHASKRVEATFAEEGLLASEHALLEDNGDGLGTSAAFFRGMTANQTDRRRAEHRRRSRPPDHAGARAP